MEYEIYKIIGITVIGVILTGVIKNFRPEFTIYVVIAVTIVLFVLVLDKLGIIFEFISEIYQNLSYGRTLFPILFKVLAVAYITDFTAQLARDAGEGAIAAKTEFAGKVIIFYLSIPIMVVILEIINSVL